VALTTSPPAPACPRRACNRGVLIKKVVAWQQPQYHPNMDLPVRKKLPHTIPQWVPEGSWFFITIKCVPRGKNQLCQAGAGDAVLSAIRYNHENLVCHCRLSLLMPDHLHAIMAFPREPGMKTTVTNWKRFVAARHDIVWQRDFFDHRLRNNDELQEKTSYILQNPVRGRLCERIEDWIWIYRPNDRPPPILG
jgi:putative transposase